jgi:glycosyltransferase involved in cell wall biosynthesis
MLLLSVASLQAATVEEEVNDSLSLHEVVVTGTRNAVDVRHLPMTVTVVGREKLAEQYQTSVLPTVMQQVPGFFVTSRSMMGYGVSTGAAGGINLRGITGGAGQLLVLIDGHPQYNGVYGHPISDSYQTLMAERVEVLRGPIWEPYAAYRKLTGAKSTEVTEISSGEKTFKQRLSLWIRANLFIPDPRVGWVYPSVKMLKSDLKEHPVDAIVTTGPPHSMHLIGLRLSRATGLPWISDFRDPWTKMYYLKHLGLSKRTWRRLGKMEQRVLDGSSTVLAVTPLVQEDFRARTRTPVAMITNGYDREDFSGPEPVPDGFFNIVHTGLFASDGNPLVFWKVLGSMVSDDPEFADRLRLRLVGKVDREVFDAIAAAGLREHVVSLGYLDHAGAVREQRGATLLILPLRNDPEYRPILPGKLFEYLAARRPILGIGQEDGAMARVLSETGAGITADWQNESAIRATLESAWNAFRQPTGLPPVTGDISRFERRALTASLARLLNSLSDRK